MRRSLGDKNAESRGDIGQSSKRRSNQGAFADSFKAQLRDEETSRQDDLRTRARDDGEIHRLQRQQSGGNNSNINNSDRREYRRSDVVAVQYLTVSVAEAAAAPE